MKNIKIEKFTLSNKAYNVCVLPCIDFNILDVLRNKYYIVRGLNKSGQWSYTVVFNTDQKGVFNHYPK